MKVNEINKKIEEKIIRDLIESRLKNRRDLDFFKRKIAKNYKIPCPSNIRLFKAYHYFLKNRIIKKGKKLEQLLITRPVRSLSGIVNISVLTKPYPCPGKCIFCPIEKGIPKSYVSGEPAVERARRLNFDPYLQVKKRIEMLENEGHPTDKIDLRIIGGTWSFYPENYQYLFIKKCFDACNRKKSKGLEESQKLNEKAVHKIIGISIETRPDFINEREIRKLRELGVTRVELGVQSIYDDILKANSRGHAVKETILATKFLKDAGFKICYQMMPNLYGSDLKTDEKMFEDIFRDQDFQPDYLKIYSCAVMKGTPLHLLFKEGKYHPYSEKELISLIKKIKSKIPDYVRIQRVARDIPSEYIVSGGAKLSNLRQIVSEEMEKENLKCRCTRCREVREKYKPGEKLYFTRKDYPASEGKEIFLSFEDKNKEKIYSLLRLRIPSQILKKEGHFLKILDKSAIIREIQTFGQSIPVGKKDKAPQHRGLGKKLIKEVEKITKKEFHLKKIAVISGIGAREYFKKLGYRLKDSYMTKNLK